MSYESDRTYGFGLGGCGVIAPTHAEAISRIENAQLLGVCDLNEDAAKACAAEHGAEAYTDLAEMLAREDLDVVNILTPSGLHARLGVQCADAGKHVICTKPIDITLENIDALIEAGDRNGVKIAATHQNRSYPVYEKVRRYIDEGRLGKLLYGNAFVPWFRSDEYYAKGWQGTKALDGGGALINQSIHYIDLLVWFMGKVERIYGFADALLHDIETEDIGSPDPKCALQENAVLAHVKQIGDVLASFEEDRAPMIDGHEARRAVEVILSIYQASETGEPVVLA